MVSTVDRIQQNNRAMELFANTIWRGIVGSNSEGSQLAGAFRKRGRLRNDGGRRLVVPLGERRGRETTRR